MPCNDEMFYDIQVINKLYIKAYVQIKARKEGAETTLTFFYRKV